ncbi:MAG TPA: cholesterol esterase, partial [Streptomyces sp.]
MASSPDVTPSADNTPGTPGGGTTERRGRVRGRRAAVLAV